MFDLENAVLDWRSRRERDGLLSPSELDELEDHLRARVDLELELTASMAPAQAFATARRELGQPAALAREFARAGKPRWRRWLYAGWGIYAASWFLPVYSFLGTIHGYGMFRDMTGDWIGAAIFFGANLAMATTALALRSRRLSCSRWLRRWVGAVGVAHIGAAIAGSVYLVVSDGWSWPIVPFEAGFWAWSASFLCVARALRLRAKEWMSPKPGKAVVA